MPDHQYLTEIRDNPTPSHPGQNIIHIELKETPVPAPVPSIKKSRKKETLFLIIIGLVLLLVSVTGLTLYYYSENNEKAEYTLKNEIYPLFNQYTDSLKRSRNYINYNLTEIINIRSIKSQTGKDLYKSIISDQEELGKMLKTPDSKTTKEARNMIGQYINMYNEFPYTLQQSNEFFEKYEKPLEDYSSASSKLAEISVYMTSAPYKFKEEISGVMDQYKSVVESIKLIEPPELYTDFHDSFLTLAKAEYEHVLTVNISFETNNPKLYKLSLEKFVKIKKSETEIMNRESKKIKESLDSQNEKAINLEILIKENIEKTTVK